MQLPASFLKHQEDIEREMHQVWTPHAGQLPIICDFLIYWLVGVFVQCGRKFGKTELAIYLCYMFALLFPGSEIYYVVDEKDHARDICWDNGRLPYFLTRLTRGENESIEDFQRRAAKGKQLEKKWIEGVNNTEMKVKFRNGSVIKVEGAKNYTAADGLSPAFIVYDEFKDHDKRFDERMRPNLMAKSGRILVIGTPPASEETNYCTVAEEFKTKPSHRFYLRPGFTNPIVYPQGEKTPTLLIEKEAYRKKNELHVYYREIEARITPDHSKAIFPMFDRAKHVRPHKELLAYIKRHSRDFELYSSFDPGTTSVFANLQAAIHKRTRVVILINELYETNPMRTVVRVMYPESRAKRYQVDEYDGHWTEIYDYEAAYFQVEVATEFDVGLVPCTKDLKNKENKLSMIKDLMLYDRFLISDECPKTISEIEGYAKDDNGKIPKKNDHNIDNLRYILNQNGYSSVPREPINLDEISERRYHTIESDLNRDRMELALLGGADDPDDYFDA